MVFESIGTLFRVGQIIDVSVIQGKKQDESGRYSVVGKHYPSRVTCLTQHGTNPSIRHGEIWECKVTRLLERAIVVEYISVKGNWKEKIPMSHKNWREKDDDA